MDGRNLPLRLQLQALPLHKILETGAATTEYIRLRIQADRQPGGPLPRLTAVLVLDISGSMKGTPIAQVKDSVSRLASILSDEDSLGVVAFSTSAQTVSPIRKMSGEEARRAVPRATDTLAVDGYTNISGGLSHAALLFAPRAPDERQLILLLSDGQPNVGTQSAPGLSSEAELIKARGIAVSTLGFGAEHNEDILLGISDAGGGRYAYIKDPLMAAPAFARALGAQRDVAAEDVQLVLSPGPGVEITRILGEARTSVGEGGLRVSLSDLLLGEEVNVVAELKVSGRREVGRWRLLRASLHARLPSGEREISTLREDVAVDVLNGPLSPSPVDKSVQEVVAMAMAAELRHRARGLSDQRNFAGAVDYLKQALNVLAAVHGGVPPEASAIRDVYETILDDIQVAMKAPARAEYQVLRKAQLDQQTFMTGFNRAGASFSPSAEHMIVKLRNTHGAVPRARLVCIEGENRGKVIELTAECRIGRGTDNHLVLNDTQATRRHALIQWIGRDFVAHDLGSSNGTFVNGRNIVDDHPLKDGDIITVGHTRFRFERPDKKNL